MDFKKDMRFGFPVDFSDLPVKNTLTGVDVDVSHRKLVNAVLVALALGSEPISGKRFVFMRRAGMVAYDQLAEAIGCKVSELIEMGKVGITPGYSRIERGFRDAVLSNIPFSAIRCFAVHVSHTPYCHDYVVSFSSSAGLPCPKVAVVIERRHVGLPDSK